MSLKEIKRVKHKKKIKRKNTKVIILRNNLLYKKKIQAKLQLSPKERLSFKREKIIHKKL